MKVRIEIDTKTFVRFWLVVIAFALAALAIYSARTALLIVGISFFLALALNPPVNWIAKHMPGRSRVGGTAIAFVLVVLVLSTFLVLVTPPIVEQTAKFAQAAPGFVDTATDKYKALDDVIQRYDLQPQVDSAVNSIKNNATSWAADFGQILATGVGSAMKFLVAALIALVMSFLMLVEGPAWLERLWRLYRDEKKMKQHRKLLTKMYSVVSGYVNGQLMVSAIGAGMSALTVFVLSLFFDIPAGLAMPVFAITFVLSLIPMFGATIAGVIITLLLAFNNLTAAIIFIIFFVIYQQVENNFVSPVVQSKAIELSALAVLIAATVGIYIFGILGGIIAIPIAGCIKVVLEEYLNTRPDGPKSKKPILKKLAHKATESN
ncbi:MAG: AI-2E family transporter [bacterium]|nr:AI-2E family transporter [bacterium]MDN5835046.1 AI-2E family transporter [bacterium]